MVQWWCNYQHRSKWSCHFQCINMDQCLKVLNLCRQGTYWVFRTSCMILASVHINVYSILGGSCVWNLLQCDHRLIIQWGGTSIYLFPSLPVESQAQSQLLLNQGCVAWQFQEWGVQTVWLLQYSISPSRCCPIAAFRHGHINELYALVARHLVLVIVWKTILHL